jgi:hypothetical protein
VVVIQSESDFYEPLGAYGRWEVVAGYGRCWVPARIEVGWRPYCNGYWQSTDAGWYWMSEEPWGWATYHYGRWDWHVRFGWFWVPQTQWAPSWVCWREGGGYVGWAPLRPSVAVGVNIHVGDYEPAHASRAYVFVEQRRMLEPVRPKTVIVNNTTVINQTVNITKVKVVNKTVIHEGPRREVIERESGRKVREVAARDVRHQEETTVVARERNIPRGIAKKGPTPVNAETTPVPTPAMTKPSAGRGPDTVKAPVAVKAPEPTHSPNGRGKGEGEPQNQSPVTAQRPNARPIPEVAAPQVATPARQVPAARPNVSKPDRDAEPKGELPGNARGHERMVEAQPQPKPQPVAESRPVNLDRGAGGKVELPGNAKGHERMVEARPQPKPQEEPVVSARPAKREVERPAAAVKVAPVPAASAPVAVRPGTPSQNIVAASPRTAGPRSHSEAGKESKAESRSPARGEVRATEHGRQPNVPASAPQVQARQVSPREQSQAPSHPAATSQKKENKGPAKKGDPGTSDSTSNAPRNAP